MKISVVIPAHNASAYLLESLPPLLAMWRRGEVTEVLVVDDASIDDTSKVAQGLGAQVIAQSPNQGPGAARNLGGSSAQGDILWFVDADVVVDDGAARVLSEAFRPVDVAAVVGSYDVKPRARNFFSQYKNLVHHYYHHLPRSTAVGFWAGCGAIRRQSFMDVGGFDANRFPVPCIEDIELGYRLGDAGAVIVSLPTLTGTHLKVWSFRELLYTEFFRRRLAVVTADA